MSNKQVCERRARALAEDDKETLHALADYLFREPPPDWKLTKDEE